MNKIGTRWRLGPENNFIRNAITKGFAKPHGVVLEFVYWVEDRCKSSGAPVGAFPGRRGAGLGGKRSLIDDFRSYPQNKT